MIEVPSQEEFFLVENELIWVRSDASEMAKESSFEQIVLTGQR